MSRKLVLSNEGARHPFRQSIVPGARLARPPRRSGLTAQDLREFLMAYCACFMAVSAFIA